MEALGAGSWFEAVLHISRAIIYQSILERLMIQIEHCHNLDIMKYADQRDVWVMESVYNNLRTSRWCIPVNLPASCVCNDGV